MTITAVQKLNNLQTTYSRLKTKKSDHIKQVLHQTFDPFVNRPLFGNSPVRKVIFNDAEKSLSILSKILSEINYALCDVILEGTSLSRIRRILIRLSKSSINILSRSLMVLNLYFDDKLLGRFSLLDFMIEDMQQLADFPNDLLEFKESVVFLNRMAKPVYDTLKLRLLNRNRQRTYLEAVILQDWTILQQEAHAVDVHYRKEKGLDNSFPPYFSHYVLNTLVELMDLHVSVGIELDLFYGQEDLSVAYWYRDFLISTQLNNLSAMRRTKAVAATSKASESNSRNHKSKKKNHHGKDKNDTDTNGQEDLELDFDFMVLGMKKVLCRGIVRVCTSVIMLPAGYFLNTICKSNLLPVSILFSYLVYCCSSSSWCTS